MSFDHPFTVRFFETDRAGIVFYGRIFEYVHAALEEVLAQALGDVNTNFDARTWGMPIVRAEADYARPMRFGDRLQVRLEVERLTERSITLAYRVTGTAPEDLRATARVKHAFIAFDPIRAAPAPAELLAGLRRMGLVA